MMLSPMSLVEPSLEEHGLLAFGIQHSLMFIPFHPYQYPLQHFVGKPVACNTCLTSVRGQVHSHPHGQYSCQMSEEAKMSLTEQLLTLGSVGREKEKSCWGKVELGGKK